MNILRKFYNYLGVEDTCITGEQVFALMCLLGKDGYKIDAVPNVLEMCNSIIRLYIEALETNSFCNITEDEIVEVLNGKVVGI